MLCGSPMALAIDLATGERSIVTCLVVDPMPTRLKWSKILTEHLYTVGYVGP